MAAWSGADRPERKRRRGRSGGAAAREAVREARERMEGGSWEGVGPRALVGLYAVLHEAVYGAAPEEVIGDAFLGAASAADRLARELGGPEKLLDLLRWTWARERVREKRREAGNGFRIGWRLMFVSRSLVVDWKTDLARQGRSARPNGSGGEKR